MPPVPSVEWESSNLEVTIVKVASSGTGGAESSTIVAKDNLLPCSDENFILMFKNGHSHALHSLGGCLRGGSRVLSTNFDADFDFRTSEPFAIGWGQGSVPIMGDGYLESEQVLANYAYP